VEVTIKWVVNAVKDYTLGLYSYSDIPLLECVGVGTGTLESSPSSKANDKCLRLRVGFSYLDGDDFDLKDKSISDLNKDLGSIDNLLETDIEAIYANFPLPYLNKKDGGWYIEYSG